ncbi:MAG: DUF1572 domain-containing protein [Balneolaceae bacterium]|nr:MAG: DUF1572 domain-containing protein [Balneolaceae bacterium]
MEKRLQGIHRLLMYNKRLTEKSLNQLDDSQVHEHVQGYDLSIAALMKHISGCLTSLWTNFRSEDGEKPWRNREDEFIDDFKSREELMEFWERGWAVLFEAIESITAEELDNIIYIRNEGHTIQQALERSLSHMAYHTGQIVLLAKLLKGDEWSSLSIPKGKTEEYNKKKFESEKSIGFYKDRF